MSANPKQIIAAELFEHAGVVVADRYVGMNKQSCGLNVQSTYVLWRSLVVGLPDCLPIHPKARLFL